VQYLHHTFADSVARDPLTLQRRKDLPAVLGQLKCRVCDVGAAVTSRKRNADVSKISGAIARENVHAPAESDGEMREVAADPDALLMTLGGGSIAPSVMITEFDPVMHVVADCLQALPAARDVCKKGQARLLSFWVSQ